MVWIGGGNLLLSEMSMGTMLALQTGWPIISVGASCSAAFGC